MASIPSQAYLNEDRRGRLLIASILGFVFSSLFFAGRMASRLMKTSFQKFSFDASDYTLLAGLILAWAIFAMYIRGIKDGLGRHIEAIAMTDPSLAGPTRIMQGLIAIDCLTLACLGCIKVSLLLLFRKLFPVEGFRRVANIVGAIVIVPSIALFFIAIFKCRPVNAFWDFTHSATANCMNFEHLMIAGQVHNIATDLAILCLPQTMIWKLQMDLKSKIAVAFTLLLGGFTMVISVVRFTNLFQSEPKDPTWNLTMLGVWSMAELAAAVASASMPCMRPLIRKFFRRSLHPEDQGNNSRRARHNFNKIKALFPLSGRSVSKVDSADFLRLEDGTPLSKEQDDARRGKTTQTAGPDAISVAEK